MQHSQPELITLYGELVNKNAVKVWRNIEKADLNGEDITPYLDQAELMGIWATIASIAAKLAKKGVSAIAKKIDKKSKKKKNKEPQKEAPVKTVEPVTNGKKSFDNKMLILGGAVAVLGVLVLTGRK